MAFIFLFSLFTGAAILVVFFLSWCILNMGRKPKFHPQGIDNNYLYLSHQYLQKGIDGFQFYFEILTMAQGTDDLLFRLIWITVLIEEFLKDTYCIKEYYWRCWPLGEGVCHICFTGTCGRLQQKYVCGIPVS